VTSRALVSVVALGLICVLGVAGAAPGGSDRASAASQFAACGDGYPKPPPKRYRFHLWGTTKYRFFGIETWDYKGVMKRMRCRGMSLEYWQTKGRGHLKFTGIDMDSYPDCNYMDPPYETYGNGEGSFRLRRFDVDVGFGWIGNRYDFSTQADRNYKNVVHGTVTCPDGAKYPQDFSHYWIGQIFQKGRPKRVVKGFYKYQDIEFYVYRIHWKLTAIR